MALARSAHTPDLPTGFAQAAAPLTIKADLVRNKIDSEYLKAEMWKLGARANKQDWAPGADALFEMAEKATAALLRPKLELRARSTSRGADGDTTQG